MSALLPLPGPLVSVAAPAAVPAAALAFGLLLLFAISSFASSTWLSLLGLKVMFTLLPLSIFALFSLGLFTPQDRREAELACWLSWSALSYN